MFTVAEIGNIPRIYAKSLLKIVVNIILCWKRT